jgi:transketolase
VKLCGQSPGMAYGELGPTHHSIEDLAWMRAIANLPVIVPADPIETEQVIRWAARTAGPVFIRIGRTPVREVNAPGYRFTLGRATELRSGGDVTVIACGTMVERALDAADALAGRGVHARVLNLPTIRPLDRDAIVAAARETGAIVTVEEHTVHGGLGGAVAEVVATELPVRMRLLGVPGVFAPTGSSEALMRRFGLTAGGIADAAYALVGRAAA